jgi:23S rRNA (adenine2030-N6)-methyltransferase
MAPNKNIRIFCEDGLKGLQSLLPPVSRRALVLIDPSYEVKTEYDQVVTALADAYRRFATGTYALWYPVVDRSRIDRLQTKLIKTGIKHILRFELAVAPDSNERGMTAAGMLVINPPWTLFDKMAAVLPRLAQQVGGNESFYHCEVLVPE